LIFEKSQRGRKNRQGGGGKAIYAKGKDDSRLYLRKEGGEIERENGSSRTERNATEHARHPKKRSNFASHMGKKKKGNIKTKRKKTSEERAEGTLIAALRVGEGKKTKKRRGSSPTKERKKEPFPLQLRKGERRRARETTLDNTQREKERIRGLQKKIREEGRRSEKRGEVEFMFAI